MIVIDLRALLISHYMPYAQWPLGPAQKLPRPVCVFALFTFVFCGINALPQCPDILRALLQFRPQQAHVSL